MKKEEMIISSCNECPFLYIKESTKFYCSNRTKLKEIQILKSGMIKPPTWCNLRKNSLEIKLKSP